MKFVRGTLLIALVLAATGEKDPCSTCKEIVDGFRKGLDGTARGNFGGGNTAWEDSRLGSYAKSETRLVEILEGVCDTSNKECHKLLEEYEEAIEIWWHKPGREELHSHLCVQLTEACCSNHTFGPECTACPGGGERPCSGNGRCDGSGTRSGSGKCLCSTGYSGELCDSCQELFFEEVRNESHIICRACHESCLSSCREAGQAGCDACKEGWTQDDELQCVDVDECLGSPCQTNQYCTNSQGSFKCRDCDAACKGCTGRGPGKCIECNPGHRFDEESKKCLDVNECEVQPSPCLTGERCENTAGSFRCVADKQGEEEEVSSISKGILRILAFSSLAVASCAAYKSNTKVWLLVIGLLSVVLYFVLGKYRGLGEWLQELGPKLIEKSIQRN